MKIYSCLTIAIVLALCSAASGQVLGHRSTDTLWVDSIVTHSGQKAVLDVSFSNTDTINAFDVPLSYTYPDLLIDSVSFVGSRVEDRFTTIVFIDTLEAICQIGGFYFDTTKEEVGPGRGLLARIYMTIPDAYETRLIPFDTTRIHTGLTFVTKYNESYVPEFRRGYVDNTFAPALADSVWVDDAEIDPGQQFDITVYAFNEHPLFKIKIPLEYHSDNIVFDSMTLTDTRSSSALITDAIADNVAKKMLLSLGFDNNLLLAQGTGPIAVLHFTCLPTGTTSTVSLDTTIEGFGDFFFQLGEFHGFLKTYPDYIPGTITINISTGAGEQSPVAVPRDYSLDQNFPNPFNPVTEILFGLPEKSRVTLEVFNILGQKIRTLIDNTLPAGMHSVTFDGLDSGGRELASGVYLYRLRTEKFTQSRRMVLLK